MECVQCGSEIQEGASFCSSCGASQGQSHDTSEATLGRRRALRGKVLDYDWKTNTGVISGDDGFRYQFDSGDWSSDQTPRAVVTVAFVAGEDHAKEIYLTTNVRGATASGIESKRFVAGLFGILLGLWGIHKFYLGYNKEGVITLIAGTFGWILIFPGFIALVVGIVEGIIYITKSDDEFNELYIEGHRPWF